MVATECIIELWEGTSREEGRCLVDSAWRGGLLE